MSEAPISIGALARQIFDLLDAAQKRQCIVVLLVSVAAACLTLVGVAGIAPFFAVLADPTVIDRNEALTALRVALGLESPRGVLIWLGAGFVALLSLANVASLIALVAIGRFSQEIGARMHSLLFAEYLHRDVSFHAANNSAVLANRVVHEVSRTVGGVIQSGLTLCASGTVILLILGAVVIVDPLLAVVAAVSVGASYALIYGLVRRRLLRNGAIATRHWRSRAQVIAESFAAIRDVIVHRAQQSMISSLDRDSRAIAAVQASTPAIAASPRYALECLMGAGLVAAALWIYGSAGADRWLTHLAFLGFAAYRLLPAVQQLFAALAHIQAERPAFEDIVADLRAARNRSTREPAAMPTGAWRGRPRREIRLVDVSYRYSADRAGGVSGISLEIPAGTLVGFVGPNGAGKSTLAEIILGLLAPDTGWIEVDGVRLDAGSGLDWLDTVAYVPQRIALVDGTLEQNIAFGVDARDVDRERVLEAVRVAQLGPLVDALPEGLAAVIGENGARLSGGQRQRVGIARALYRRASLLVVDEGTSSLDALTENEIMVLLGTLRGTCTIVVVGHRPSALVGCDLVFELDSGRLAGRKALVDDALAAQSRGAARR